MSYKQPTSCLERKYRACVAQLQDLPHYASFRQRATITACYRKPDLTYSISVVVFFLSVHFLPLFFVLASVSVNNLHSCLRFTICRYMPVSWLDLRGAAFYLQGQNLQIYRALSLLVQGKCFRSFLSASAILCYIFYYFAICWEHFVIFLMKYLFFHLRLQDQSEVYFIV